MENNNNESDFEACYRTFFEKSREIVKKISKSFTYDPDRVNPETNLVWDREVSLKIREIHQNFKSFEHFNFYSEEHRGESLSTPLFLIDPIDGSREFLLDIPECATSMSFITSWDLSETNQGAHWIWNFRTGEEVMLCEGKLSVAGQRASQNKRREKLLGLVSRREWEEGAFKSFTKMVDLKPTGSIAYKLVLLAHGACDFVYSRSNKNIWDIAAGSFLLSHLGYSMYNRSGRVIELGNGLVNGPILWCKEDDYSKLAPFLSF